LRYQAKQFNGWRQIQNHPFPGLVAAIPAVVVYNLLVRMIAGYRMQLGDASAEVLRLVSRDLERAAVPSLGTTPLYRELLKH
jgi:hypothetical protein